MYYQITGINGSYQKYKNIMLILTTLPIKKILLSTLKKLIKLKIESARQKKLTLTEQLLLPNIKKKKQNQNPQ